jgi:uncharacterized protein (TIGR02300 family)
MTRAKKPKAPRKAADAESSRRKREPAADDRKTKLGTKYLCFSCKAKFYDLNKPEPLCPKCGADQRLKPKETATPQAAAAAPAKRPPVRPMPALLDEEDAESVPFEEEMDLDLGDLEPAGADEEFFDEEEGGEAPEDDAEEP